MQTLYDRLKPEYREKLEGIKDEYGATYNALHSGLTTKTNWDNLNYLEVSIIANHLLGGLLSTRVIEIVNAFES